MKTGDNAQENARGPRLFRNARLATVAPGLPGLGIVEKGALAVENGRIAYAGPEGDLPATLQKSEVVDLEGRWITPGLIDCHTHLIYAGNRAHDFAGGQQRNTRPGGQSDDGCTKGDPKPHQRRRVHTA